MSVKVFFISLGCAKNLVDSEHMLALVKDAGMEIASDPMEADVAVVNTCGFIEPAKQEAIENILEMARLKEEGALKALVVTGCLAERYKEQVMAEMPEVDAVLGTGSYGEIVAAIEKALAGRRHSAFAPVDEAPIGGERVVSTPFYTAYLKIAEGCNNHCAYCVIPSLRGPYRSRPLEELLAEATALAKAGVKELILVAQDTSRYGMDLYGKRALPDLLTSLCRVEGLCWIRVLYLYPDEVEDALIDAMASLPKVLPYFDLPIQHCNDKLLRAMNRRGSKELIASLFRKVRAKMPDAVLRTSLIAGLPGEGEAEFLELCDFLREMELPRVGVFTYSAEEGSAAAEMPDQVDEETKRERQRILSEIQSGIADRWNRTQVGRTLSVLVEGFDPESGRAVGRCYADAPDVDGRVLFVAKSPCDIGDFVPVLITGADDFDLLGEGAE